jgi:hypothetical protein
MTPDNRPGNLQQSDLSDWQDHAQRAIDGIAASEGCSREEATRRLRQSNPEVADGNPPMDKRAPMTFEDAVEIEMRKGVNAEVAGQRVAQAHGFTLPHRITKGDNISFEFAKRAEDIWQADSSLSRTESSWCSARGPLPVRGTLCRVCAPTSYVRTMEREWATFPAGFTHLGATASPPFFTSLRRRRLRHLPPQLEEGRERVTETH